MIGRPRGRALLLGAVVAVVAVVVGAAIAVLGPPGEERNRRLDLRRIDDLQDIAEAVEAFRGSQGALPADLDALVEWRGVGLASTDPVTGTAYRYRPTGDAAYELCAAFAARGPEDESRMGGRYAIPRHGIYWHHPAGDHCFALEAKEAER